MNELKLVENKIEFFNNIVQSTILHIQTNKSLQILLENEYNTCIQLLSNLNDKIVQLNLYISTNYDKEVIIGKLQVINNELSSILKSYGTESFEKLLTVCFGNNKYIQTNDSILLLKNELLKNYFHPTGYKVVHHKPPDDNTEDTEHFHCSDIMLTSSNFHNKVYGMKVYIKNVSVNKSLIVFGVVDDVVVEFLNNPFISNKLDIIKKNIPSSEKMFHTEMFNKYLSSLSLKELLVSSHTEIYNKFIGYSYLYKIMKNKPLNSIIKDFLLSDLYSKRNMLLLLFFNMDEYENTFIAYILYDLLSNDNNIQDEQNVLFNSMPLIVRQFFYSSMKKIIHNTNDYSNKDVQSVSLEQRIHLLKTPSSVKDKAFIKLKEIKSKTEDNNSKARHYLDGLLNIPFGIFKSEPILNVMANNRAHFNHLTERLIQQNKLNYSIPKKDKYTNMEIIIHVKNIKDAIYNCDANINSVSKTDVNQMKNRMIQGDKQQLIENITTIQSILDNDDDSIDKINKKHTKTDLKQHITKLIQKYSTNESVLNKLCNISTPSITQQEIDVINTHIDHIQTNNTSINKYLCGVGAILDKSVYGNRPAKLQIEKIIGQWINGEQKGYCFGFEGPPGVGKTTLAKKGIADCLKDENEISRPFSFIQMGGDTNGSTIHGHNYTYVGSNWGSIVQILMDTQIMNPIIYIDEVDKISKTEHGREIIGILTHLLDFSQNDKFQDKFFHGIEVDMSKALFILSYNDPSMIDPILLDRIHRIQFQYLSTEDKIVITKLYLLPEILSNMGLDEMIVIDDIAIQYLVEKYTLESGVRKLKELLFEIIGEININIFKNMIQLESYPIHITIPDIQTYLKDRNEVIPPEIYDHSHVGIINGMWANSLGQGGILKIFAQFFPSAHFMDLKLTGLLEKVMQESMHVAETLSWSLTSKERKEVIVSDKHKYGIHIHAGEGSVSKDGPSGGVAITTLIYSLLNDLKIRNNFAITGEIDLNGNVCEIGGLDLKIIGSIKSGVTSFIFPHKNIKDYHKLLKKYDNNDIFTNISFYPVNTIHEVFEIIFDN